MAKLKIKLDDLIQALTTHFEMLDGGGYLDAETGQILLHCDGGEDIPEDIEENPRYRLIDPLSSHDSYSTMGDFVETVDDAGAVDLLNRALNGPKPFRRFKDALLEFPALREGWFK